jgi:hypothetical protein
MVPKSAQQGACISVQPIFSSFSNILYPYNPDNPNTFAAERNLSDFCKWNIKEIIE